MSSCCQKARRDALDQAAKQFEQRAGTYITLARAAELVRALMVDLPNHTRTCRHSYPSMSGTCVAKESGWTGPYCPHAWDPPDATHRCKICDARWRLNPPTRYQPEGSWSVVTPRADWRSYPDHVGGQLWPCGPCCDNVTMGEQIEPLPYERTEPAQKQPLIITVEGLAPGECLLCRCQESEHDDGHCPGA